MRKEAVLPVAQLLAKIAADRELIVRMTKTAGVLGRVMGMFGRAAPAAARTAPRFGANTAANAYRNMASQVGRRAATAAPRVAAAVPQAAAQGGGGLMGRIGRRAAMGAGIAGAGTVGAGHMVNDASGTVGRSWNPLTWANPQSASDVFANNRAAYEGMQNAHQSAIADAYARGDFSGASTMQEQADSGGFGASPWSLGGLNPFVQRQAKSYADTARYAQAQEAPQREALKKYIRENGASLDPATMAKLNDQLKGMEARQAVQVPWGASGGGAPAAQATEPSGWNVGGQMRMPAYMSGMAMQPNDFRPYPQPWDYLQSSNNPTYGG